MKKYLKPECKIMVVEEIRMQAGSPTLTFDYIYDDENTPADPTQPIY